MRPTNRMLAAGALLAALAGQGLAEEVSFVTDGGALFNFDAPEGWLVRDGFESTRGRPEGVRPEAQLISLLPPEEELIMWTGLWAPPDVRSFAEARAYLGKAVPRLLEAPESTYNDSRTIGGMPARVWSGVGFRDGRDMDFSFAAIQIARERIALVAFIGEPAAWDRHEASLIAVLNSIEAGAGQ